MADLIQKLSRHVFFPLSALREGSTTLKHLAELERTQYLSKREIEEIQMQRLGKLLAHAYTNCPFYRNRFDECRVKPKQIQSLEDLRVLPILTKKEIQENGPLLCAANLPMKNLVSNSTGGSTGSPLQFYMDQDRVFSRQAATFRHNRWSGWEIGTKSALLWASRKDLSGLRRTRTHLRNFLLDRRIILDTTGMTREALIDFQSRLQRHRPEIYIGYANSIFLFARFLKESGSSDYHRPRAIITSAEVLEGDCRRIIEEVFDCRVFDRYGARETSVLATECDRHQGLHICAETFIVEVIRDGKPAAPGETGKVIVTDLLNYGMPFIRYQIEDAAIPADGSCACGRGLPLIRVAAGRITDFLVTPEGRVVSGAALTISLIARTPGLAQAQIVQESRDRIILRLVRGKAFDEGSLEFLRRSMVDFFGSSVRLGFDWVDQIPLEPSGKYRFSISQVDPAEIF